MSSNKFTFAAGVGNSFRFLFGSGPSADLNASYELGFSNQDTAYATTQTSDNICDLSGQGYVHLRLDNVNGVNVQTTNQISCFATIPLDGAPFSQIFFLPNSEFCNVKLTAPQSFSYLDVRLVNPDASPCDMQGAEWSFTLGITTC